MDRSRMRKYVLSFVVVLLVGCGLAARMVTVSVTRPAEIDLKHIDKIAVGEIKGRGSGVLEGLRELGRSLKGGETKTSGSGRFAAELAEALFESGRFELLDYGNLKMRRNRNDRSPDSLASGRGDEDVNGSFNNVAVVSGEILRYDYDRESSHRDYSSEDKKTGRVKTTRTYYREATATVSVSLRIVDASTSKVLARRKFNESEDSRVSKRGSYPDRIPSEPLFDACRMKIIRKFVRMISSYTEVVSIMFETDKELPQLKQGIAFAELGDWENATRVFEQAAQTHSTSPLMHKVHYNLGLSYMYADRFDEARTALKKAYTGKPTRLYSMALKDLDERVEDTRRLEEQRRSDSETEASDR